VFIHRILARDTVDLLVLQRLETKREVQDILMEAMKHRRKAGQKKMSGLNA
jgi:SNF2 family DNA or RNA helicase